MKHASKVLLRDISCHGIRAHVLSSPPEGTLHFKVESVAMDWHIVDKSVYLLVPFELTMEQATSENQAKVSIGTVSVDMSLVYRLRDTESPIPNEDMPHVLGVNGYMHSWPYFRADVQWLTTKLGLPPLTLPVVLSGEVPGKVLIAPESLVIGTSPPAATTKEGQAAKRKRRRA